MDPTPARTGGDLPPLRRRAAARHGARRALLRAALLAALALQAGPARAQISPPGPILLPAVDVAVAVSAPRALRSHGARPVQVQVRNIGDLTAHVDALELLARFADGSDAGTVTALGPEPGALAAGSAARARFLWRAPDSGLPAGEPVLFFACARIAEEDRSPENDCDLALAGPRRDVEAPVIADDFEGDALQPYWQAFTAGTGSSRVSRGMAGFVVTRDSHAGEYSDAEINDYHRGPDRGFPWRPGVRLEIRARASDDNGVLGGSGRGTRGFGFWNLGTGGPGSPTGMTNAWFISISPDSFGGMFGIFAATVFDRGMPVLLQPLSVDLRRWHRYGIVWTQRGVTFAVDDRPVAASPVAPAERLGFVAWIDNYRLTITPDGIETDFLDLDADQALFVDSVRLWAIDASARR